MNQLTVADTRADLDLAKAFSTAKMVPKEYQGSPGDCYIAIKLAQRFKMDPWSVMQEMFLVQGRPMMSGKLATAILNNSLAEPLRPTYAGEGDERTITLTGRPEGDAQPLSVTLKVKDAKTNNAQWAKIPDQMLMYAAARMWGRRYAPDILLGIVFDDEETEATLVPQAPKTHLGAPSSILPKGVTSGDIIDQLTGEVITAPAELTLTESERWVEWGKRFVTALRTSPDIDTVDQWLAANAEILANCEKDNTKVHGNILAAVKQFKIDIMNQGEGS
jgi:hypothetical protein